MLGQESLVALKRVGLRTGRGPPRAATIATAIVMLVIFDIPSSSV
jgi:hypothetical protein